MANKIIPYRSDLKLRAREMRGNMTKAEKLLWNEIRRKSLGVEFHRQVPLLDYIVDFYCHEIGLIIEVDGRIHSLSVLEDAFRQERLEKEGLRFLRFKNEEIYDNLKIVLLEIEEKVKEFTS